MPPLFADANRWLIPLPPVWLLGMAALLTVLAALAVWGLMRLVTPRAAAEARVALGDGFLGPLAWLLVSFSAVALAFTPLVGLPLPPDFSLADSAPLAQFGRSFARMTAANDFRETVMVEPQAALQPIPLPLRPQEMARIELIADRPLVVRTQQPVEGFALVKEPDVRLEPGRPWLWQRTEGATNPFLGAKAKLEATSEAAEPTRLEIRWQLEPEHPQAAILPWAFIVLGGIVAAYATFRLGCERISAIAAATTKEAIGQPLFAVALVAGIFLIAVFVVIPYNTFGEDVKMYKDSGLTLIKVLALLVVVWAAGVTVSEEIDGRTALTVLSKPLTRWQFVLGKFAGLVLVSLLVFLVLGGVLLALTNFKVVYDAREGAKVDPVWWECAAEMITVVPGLALAFLETVVMAAIALAVSTRLGTVANLVICFAVYSLGHLVPLIVQSSVGKFAIVRFTGRLFATLLPVLDHFTVEAAVVGGVPIPWDYLGWAALYAGLYSAVAILLALVLFQHRDLA
jgi:ABC-type transport system involved in multi-copper enzyme maturation permease subunit